MTDEAPRPTWLVIIPPPIYALAPPVGTITAVMGFGVYQSLHEGPNSAGPARYGPYMMG